MAGLKSRWIAFKEWSLVCDALGTGRQSIILRKGGIAEGRGGFRWQADRFFLFPTHFHEQAEKVIWQPTAEAHDAMGGDDEIIIRFAAQLDRTWTISSWTTATSLAPLHIWREEVIRERLGCGEKTSVSLALVRVFRLHEPWILRTTPAFGGCRSWLELPEREFDGGSAVISDAEHAARRAQIERLLSIQ
ncbi:MAG: DUF1802 family protein [Verrucomicrobiales bacterium]